jgi:hypothetical protein
VTAIAEATVWQEERTPALRSEKKRRGFSFVGFPTYL